MNLYSMILKNIRYNIKNYIAYFIGNSFILCILFMFINLLLSKAFMMQPKGSVIKSDLITIVVLIVAFSIAFILYTAISFTNYRGKEFGVYFTIGLTSKNIINILSYENIIISGAAFICGSLLGSLFSKLFYMVIIKILNLNNINFEINIMVYVYIFLIALLIFIFNSGYQILFLKRLSIVQSLKSNSKKYCANSNDTLGIIGLVILVSSMIVFPKICSENNSSKLIINISLSIISMYFVIGFIMRLITKISKVFRGFYNSNMLVLNSLIHRFIEYRNVIYIVTLLVSGAMVFMSVTYSLYKSTQMGIDSDYPYDLSFVVSKNEIGENLKDIIKSSGADIKTYTKLENIEVPDIRLYNNKIINVYSQIGILSESNYNIITKKNVHINKDHAIFIHREKRGRFLNSGLIIDFTKNNNKFNSFLKDYKKTKKRFIYIPKENKVDKIGMATNCLLVGNYSRLASIVINDNEYKRLKQNSLDSSIYYDILVNINNNNDYKKIEKNLRHKLNKIGNSTIKTSLVLKREKFNKTINSRKFELFIYSFLGSMLLLGSAVTLYFKIFTSLEDDKNIKRQLIKLGLTNKDINKLIIKELIAVFLMSPVIALILVGYYLSRVYSLVPGGNYMWSNSLFVFSIYGVIQIIFFIITTNQYLKRL